MLGFLFFGEKLKFSVKPVNAIYGYAVRYNKLRYKRGCVCDMI